jgi:mRNA-degrading endonuclease RelE of RelBE toxin-antitoxin system
MVNVDIEMKLENPCIESREVCINCHSHFMRIRPLVKSFVISKRFFRDLKDEEELTSVVRGVLDCSSVDFNELHKFEENVDGNLVFRARKGGVHIVYCVDRKMRIIFLRAFKNYGEYGKFLDDKKEIKRMIARV